MMHWNLQQRLLLATVCLGVLLGSMMLFYLNHAREQMVAVTGLNTGRAVSSQIVSLRAFYTKEIASRAQKAGMTLNHDFQQIDGSLPLPATLVKTLGEKINKDYPGTFIFLKSNYPFPNRRNEAGLDAFQARAMASLVRDPKTPVHLMENYRGHLSIRYAVADVMLEGCVACHNRHPLSPKKDWKVGDVRGMVEVIVPVDEVNVQINSQTRNTIGLVLVAFLVMGIIIRLVLQQILIAPLARLKQGIDALTQGDLTRAIDASDAGEIGQLGRELEHMRQQLHGTLQAVHETAASLGVGSRTIEYENNDLHSRTEQTASTLEQTAAAMEQLGTTIDQNAQSAVQGHLLAQQASQIASQGGEAVNKVIGTMHDIHASSQQIVDIIGVIDAIAFQTNILALNAAVEAAHAGEQGRGFAVVASEVRALAARSAEAAKSVKHLIGASVEQVQKGSELVAVAGNTMQDVVVAISKVTRIMDDFSLASKEQALGVNQVAQAVGQMDQSTQKNARLAQGMTQASVVLRHQADELEQKLAHFTLAKTA